MWNWEEAAVVGLESSGGQTEVLKSTAREGGTERNVRKMFKMLREVWLNIGVEKIDMHKGVTVKAILNSGTTGIFMDWKMAARHEFRLQRLERLVVVRNINGTNNSMGAITHQVEVNMTIKFT